MIEREVALPGGALLTKRSGGDTWSLPNLHRDTVVTTDGAGVVAGVARTYDPFGRTTSQPFIDNSAGPMDAAWLGQHQRMTEHETGLAQTMEMGARQYDPVLGRFLEVDPVEGGSATEDYVNADPVNDFDLMGTWSFKKFFKRALHNRCVRGAIAARRGRSLAGSWVGRRAAAIGAAEA